MLQAGRENTNEWMNSLFNLLRLEQESFPISSYEERPDGWLTAPSSLNICLEEEVPTSSLPASASGSSASDASSDLFSEVDSPLVTPAEIEIINDVERLIQLNLDIRELSANRRAKLTLIDSMKFVTANEEGKHQLSA